MNTRFSIVCAVAMVAAARPVAAQTADAYRTTFSANLDVAYHERLHDGNPAGAHFDVATTVKPDVPRVEVVGEVGFNRFSHAAVVSVLGGARVRIPIEDDRFLPFAEGLLGLYHCGECRENELALQAGGGVDFRIPRRRSFRLRAQLDFRHVFSGGAGFDGVRLSGGIVLPLAGR
jgi:hypothetical protein